MVRMMLRPRWLAALAAALGVAASFAFLAQWQLGRAVEDTLSASRPTEAVVPLAERAEPGVATAQSLTGQRASAHGHFVAGDTAIIPGRTRVAGGSDVGVWVVAHFITDQNRDLAVVVGWAPDSASGQAASGTLGELGQSQIIGRFVPSEAPEVPKRSESGNTLTAVSVAALVNTWAHVSTGGTYFGYVIAEQVAPLMGLRPILTPPPQTQAALNWLNLFYALEWIVFAGFAVYFWYRLVKDAVERERDGLAQAAQLDSPS